MQARARCSASAIPWQLAIDTGMTIVTFRMVFLIQNTQNRDAEAMQISVHSSAQPWNIFPSAIVVVDQSWCRSELAK